MAIVELIITEEQKHNFCKQIGVPYIGDFLMGLYENKENLRRELGCVLQKNTKNIYIEEKNEIFLYKIIFESEDHKTKFVLKYC